MNHQSAVAYMDPRQQAGIWLVGDGVPTDGEMPSRLGNQAAYRVDPSALQIATTLPGAGCIALKPPAPPPGTGEVDQRTAEAALRDVLSALRAADHACSQLRAKNGEDDETATAYQPTIKTLGKMTTSLVEFYGAGVSMDTLQLKLFEIQSNGILDLMSLSFSHQKMLRDVETGLMRRKVDAENRAREEQAKMNEKAGKGGVYSLVCSWAMGAAQLVTGAVKLLTGQPQGVVDIAAGIAGITKSILMTVVYCHPELQEELHDDIERCAAAELVLGGISAASSLFSAARTVQAGRFMVKAVVKLGQGEGKTLGLTLSRAINMSDEAAQLAKTAAEPVATLALKESRVVMAAAEQLAANVGKEIARGSVTRMEAALQGMFKACAPNLARRLTSMFSEEAIERLVSDSLMRAARTVAKKGYGDAVSLVQQEFAKQVEREAMRGLTRAAFSRQAVLRLATTVVSTGTAVATPILSGSMRIEFAGKQREVNELLLDAIVLGFLIDNMRRTVKQDEEFRENLMEELQSLTTNATKGVREAIECMQQVVGNTA